MIAPLPDEIIRRRTYTLSDTACQVVDNLAIHSRRKKEQIIAVAVYNLTYDVYDCQRLNDCGLKGAVTIIDERLAPADTYVSMIVGDGMNLEQRSYRRTYSFSIITRQIIDNISMLSKFDKSRLVEMALLNAAYDIAQIRGTTGADITTALHMLEDRIATRPLEAYVSFSARMIDSNRSDLDDFIFIGLPSDGRD